MPTGFLIAWAAATVALALYLMYADHRDETRRRARAQADAQYFAERAVWLSLLEGIVIPIVVAVVVSFFVGGVGYAFSRVFALS